MVMLLNVAFVKFFNNHALIAEVIGWKGFHLWLTMEYLPACRVILREREIVCLHTSNSRYVLAVEAGWKHIVKVEYYMREEVAEVHDVRLLHMRESGDPDKCRRIFCLQEEYSYVKIG